jgi:glyoxylase-like metal-dependent hydrolase (beta-lactamase superfamily II)
MNAQDTYSFSVGELQCLALNDGTAVTPLGNAIANVPAEQWQQAFVERGYSATETVFYYNCLFLQAGRHRVLIDAGLGQDLAQQDQALLQKYNIRLPRIERHGTLLGYLQAAGVSPGDIDLVVITHGDGDHVGGLTWHDQLVFPQAHYVLSQESWDFWSNQAHWSQLPEFLTAFGQKTLPLIRDRVQVVAAGQEFLPGFQLISAPGHRPGHSAVAIVSAGQRLLHLADAVAHPLLMEHPSWQWYVDTRPDQAEKDKVYLLSQAAAQQALVFGSHLPFPGVGHVIPHGQGWRWQPLNN